ncbi:MAG: MBL fold metallo-hydrolase [Methylophilaceae bacterium]|nr:MBL fold metallo-hydrolase [Methylophilaceae bacterium]
MTSTPSRIFSSIVASFLLAGLAQAADQPEPLKTPPPARQAIDFSKVEIKTIKIANDLYALEGQGGNITVLTGADGVLVVDSQFAPLTEKLVAAIKKLSDKPIRYLINTHVHGDHVGGNENFAKLGATIIARDQVRTRLLRPNPAADGTPGKPAPALALPVLTFDGATSLHFNGESVRLTPIRNAHTDGDTLVTFPKHDVLAVGDYFRSEGYPVVDLTTKGSLAGTLDGLGATIGRAGANTKIIPGHGQIADRKALIAQRDQLIVIRDKVAALIAQNKTIEEVIAAKPTAEFDAQVPKGAESAERFIKMLYAEIKATQ